MAGCRGMTSRDKPQSATKTSEPSGSAVLAGMSWIVAVGLVIAQLATVLASSKTAWFLALCTSIGLFGILIFSRFFTTRHQSDSSLPRFNPLAADTPPVDTPPASNPLANRTWSWFTFAAMTLILVAGLFKAPHRSDDVYAYGAYGRLVSAHSVSPYTTRPSAFPTDPVTARMASGWRNTRSVYGPVFTAVSAVGMRIAGTSTLIERLWFQTLAAAATGLSALLLKRMAPQIWWLFALNPVTLIVVAHEGHNDALVGLGILSALWFVRRGFLQPRIVHGEFLERGFPQRTDGTTPSSSRFIHGAMGSLVFAASIKITAILAAPAVAMWVLGRVGWKRAARIFGTWAVVCLGLFVATGGPSAFGAFRGLRTFRSTTSIWHLDVIRQLTDHPDGKPGTLALTIPALLIAATGLLVLWRSWQAWASYGSQDKVHNHPYDFPTLVAMTLIPLIIFISLGLYILPWYWGWLLAPTVLVPTRFRFTVLFPAAAHTIAYGAGTRMQGPLATVFHIARFIAPLAFVVVLVTGVFALLHRPRSA